MSITRWFILLVIVGVTIFDIVALLVGGIDATISVTMYNLSRQYPIIPFALGVIAGHLFWPVVTCE